MSAARMIVIGGSSGGVEALRTLVKTLPSDLPAAVCVALHIAPTAPDLLPDILCRAGALPATSAVTGAKVENGRIYVAPPDHHLLLEPGTMRITKGPRENRSRPAVDPLFRSAAAIYGPGAIGVLLTGDLDDGTAGLWTLKRLGGIAIIQDPAQAPHPSMPASAQRHVDVDYVAPIDKIGALLTTLVKAPAEARPVLAKPESVDIEVDIANGTNAIDAGVQRLGEPSSIACPECHGVLLRLADTHVLRFRCHTGHAYTVESLIAAVDDAIEDAVWGAARALEEKGILFEQLASALQVVEHRRAGELRDRAFDARRQSERVRQVAMERQVGAELT